MKNKIIEKLGSRRGVTILMALMFLLMCALVGSVVISSASANIDRVAGRKQTQGEYLALSSAARFVEDTLDGIKCEAVESVDRYGCVGATIVGTHHRDVFTWTKSMTIVDGDGKLHTYLQTLADQFYKAKPKYNLAGAGTPPSMPVKFQIQGDGMNVVDVELTMDKYYKLTFTLTVPGTSYQAILVFDGTPQPKEERSVELTCHHDVMQMDPATGLLVPVDTVFNGHTYYQDTEIIWTKKSLTKGAGTS